MLFQCTLYKFVYIVHVHVQCTQGSLHELFMLSSQVPLKPFTVSKTLKGLLSTMIRGVCQGVFNGVTMY